MAIYKRAGKGGPVYWFRFEIDGREYRRSARTTVRRIAEERERAAREAIVASGHLPDRKRVRRFDEAAQAWLDSLVSQADKTRQNYTFYAGRLVDELGRKLVAAITADDVVALQRKRLDEGLGARRINLEVTVLRMILKRERHWSRLADDIKMLKERHDVGQALSFDDEAKLLDAARQSGSPSLLPLVVLSMDTGLRASEVRSLRRCDLDLEWSAGVISRGGLTVARSKTEAGTGRYIPLTARTRGVLSIWLSRPEFADADATSYVFPRHAVVEAKGGEPTIVDVRLDLPVGEWKKAWRRARRLSGLSARWHDLRHSFVTRLAESPAVSEQTIRSLAGHVSKQMLSRYSHIRNDAKRAAIDVLEREVGKQPDQNPDHLAEADAPSVVH